MAKSFPKVITTTFIIDIIWSKITTDGLFMTVLAALQYPSITVKHLI